MNIRSLYLALIVFLSLALLYEWNSEQKTKSIKQHLDTVGSSTYKDDSKFVSIENDELSLVVSVSNGSIVEARLKKYPVENVNGSLGFRVFGSSESSAFQYYFKSGFTGIAPVYEVSEKGDDFVVLLDPELGVSKRISFSDASYEVSVYDSTVNGINGKSFAGLYRSEGRALDLKRGALEGGMMNNSSYEGVAISTELDPYSTSRLRSVDKPLEVLSKSGWVAFIQKYFFAAIIGSDEYIYNYYVLPKESGFYRMGYTVEGSSTSNLVYGHEHRLFVGPKIRKDLMERADNLELAIDMGWFWFLAQPLSSLLNFINSFVGNWGVSIIILTALIKILFWPLTGMGFRSMGKMRAITPELKSIQDRYKNDRQKLSSEMMALYKREGVNPLGGCFPLLASFPFFIALFFVLRESLELRHAPFAFWLTDLSAPDPFFVLPLVMALLMFLTTKLNPTPPNADPTQMMVMKFMPVGISIIFIFFPSGLVLYSVANSGIQLIQQTLLYREVGGLKN